jgi:hypothetical protein
MVVGRAIAIACLALGVLLGADALGILPADYAIMDLSPQVAAGAGAGSTLLALVLLARDHRGSDLLTAILLIALSVFTGWLTFHGPDGLIEGGLAFIPAGVREAVGRLMFGLGVVACGVMAFFGLRRLLG